MRCGLEHIGDPLGRSPEGDGVTARVLAIPSPACHLTDPGVLPAGRVLCPVERTERDRMAHASASGGAAGIPGQPHGAAWIVRRRIVLVPVATVTPGVTTGGSQVTSVVGESVGTP